MKFDWFVFLILILKPTDLQRLSFKDEWVVWNIGQGQWATHIQGDTCRHYDIGGEISFARDLKIQIQRLCFSRRNEIYVSHWDFDHYSFIEPMTRWVPQLCWADVPKWLLQKKSVAKVKALNIPLCSAKIETLSWRPSLYKSTNESSAVRIEQKVLIPGDSPVIKEKIWQREFQNLNSMKVLILGHHGSRTSTGSALLQKLPGLNFAIASARYAKYHHPHKVTLGRLKKQKVPVLKTEDWGHIHWIVN